MRINLYRKPCLLEKERLGSYDLVAVVCILDSGDLLEAVML